MKVVDVEQGRGGVTVMKWCMRVICLDIIVGSRQVCVNQPRQFTGQTTLSECMLTIIEKVIINSHTERRIIVVQRCWLKSKALCATFKKDKFQP